MFECKQLNASQTVEQIESGLRRSRMSPGVSEFYRTGKFVTFNGPVSISQEHLLSWIQDVPDKFNSPSSAWHLRSKQKPTSEGRES